MVHTLFRYQAVSETYSSHQLHLRHDTFLVAAIETETETDRQTEGETGQKTERQRDRQTDRRTGGLTDRRTDRQTDIWVEKRPPLTMGTVIHSCLEKNPQAGTKRDFTQPFVQGEMSECHLERKVLPLFGINTLEAFICKDVSSFSDRLDCQVTEYSRVSDQYGISRLL